MSAFLGTVFGVGFFVALIGAAGPRQGEDDKSNRLDVAFAWAGVGLMATSGIGLLILK